MPLTEHDRWVLDQWERLRENPPCEDDLGFLDNTEEPYTMTEEEENEYIEEITKKTRAALIKGGYHG